MFKENNNSNNSNSNNNDNNKKNNITTKYDKMMYNDDEDDYVDVVVGDDKNIMKTLNNNNDNERITIFRLSLFPWWRHQMEIFSALLDLCAGYSPVSGEFPSQRPVTRTFDAPIMTSL